MDAPVHRLVAEARLNGLDLEAFVAAVREAREGLRFLDPEEWAVHHVDENTLNNDPDNLEVLTHDEHRKRHLSTAISNIVGRLVPSKVASITRVDVLPTYDLEVEGASAFVANGIAVHNSGKTTVLYGLLAKLKRRALVMVWTEGLLKQWRERAVEELGMSPQDVGLIQGTTERIEPLTLAMQQTIASRFAGGDFSLADAFDIVGVDEVQRMAAETCYAAVDPFSARVRVGVSADHTRKDRKEFLIRDLFGDVAGEVSEAETIAAGKTVDVEIFVVPTRFKAPWYRYRQDFNLLLEKMAADEERNEIVLRIARKVASEGEQVLVFTHRVEHARTIDARLVQSGIRSGVLVGGRENAVAFDRAKAGIKSGEVRAAVGTYQAIAQGLDLPTVSRGVCSTPCANNRQQVGQVRGRICRSASGKDFGRLYYLWDRAVYGNRPITNFAKWHKTVRVWDGSTWAEGKAFLERERARRRGAA